MKIERKEEQLQKIIIEKEAQEIQNGLKISGK